MIYYQYPGNLATFANQMDLKDSKSLIHLCYAGNIICCVYSDDAEPRKGITLFCRLAYKVLL